MCVCAWVCGGGGDTVNDVYLPVQTIAHTSNRVTTHLDDHTLWAELAVLSRFMLALSFNNKVNGNHSNNITITTYVCSNCGSNVCIVCMYVCMYICMYSESLESILTYVYTCLHVTLHMYMCVCTYMCVVRLFD